MVKVLDIDKFQAKGSENLVDPEEFLAELQKIRQDCLACYKKSYEISEEKKELDLNKEVKNIKQDIRDREKRFNEKHEELVKNVGDLAKMVSGLVGR